MQKVGPVHDTAGYRRTAVAVEASRELVQEVPFHWSRSVVIVASFPVVVGTTAVPPAVQKEALVHDTEVNQLSPAVGAGTIDQALPFHCSTSGVIWTVPSFVGVVAVAVTVGDSAPTAMQKVDPTHDTEDSVLSGPPVGAGTVEAVQALPE
jgi:hypothetical protein